jgi:capsular exopolysaccharide synthesis family protein
MDKISRALEMARKSRRPDTRWQAQSVDDITYTSTRSVTLDSQHLRDNLIIGGIDDKRIIDSYKVLRTRVLQRMQQNNWKTLGITSLAENEGKTLTAINLALAIAMQQNNTVVLVDADLRRPSIHKYLGFVPELGLYDYLQSNVAVEEILVHPNIDRLVLLPGNESTYDASELLASPKMAHLVEELKSRYRSRLVLFDLPPVHVGDDVLAFAPHLDTVLIVVEDGKSRSELFIKAIELLEGTDIIGAVLNKSSEPVTSHGYYY